MSLLKKNFSKKPSLLKPAAIVLGVLLVIGGAYSLLGGKKAEEKNDEQKNESELTINPSGLDKDMRVKTVEDVEKVLEKWIDANPKAIIASVQNMQKKMMEDQLKNAQKNIPLKADELFNDKNSPQYAPAGYDVTIVEFFDYACGYCKKAQSTLEALLKEDKKLRVIYKEFPIFGKTSEEASAVAIAVNIIDPAAYKKFHDALMKSNERGKSAALKAAAQAGLSTAKVEAVLKSDKEKISAIIQGNLTLGSSIGITGTPGFVIGEELVPGAFDVQTFKDKIAAIRAKKS